MADDYLSIVKAANQHSAARRRASTDALTNLIMGMQNGGGGKGGAAPVVSASSSGGSTGGASSGNLDAILAQAGFKGNSLKMAKAIAMAESGGNHRAHNGNAGTGDNSYGLFQINMLGSMGPERLKQYGLKSNNDLFDALTNAKVAYKMSGGGKNWAPWSTYKRGDYKKYL